MQKLNMSSKQRKMAIGISSVIGVLVLLLGVIVLTGDDADEQIVADDVAVEREVERSPVSTTPKSTTTKPEPKATTSTTVPEPEEVPETTEAPPTTEKPVETTQPTPPPAPPTTQAPPPPAPPVTQAPPPPPPPPAPPTTQAPPPPPPPPAQGVVRRPDLEGQTLNRINQERSKAGLSTLARNACIADQAAAPWAKHMASTGYRGHNPEAGSKVLQCGGPWDGGEIIAGGGSGFDAVSAWMNSPPHKSVMLRSEQSKVGIGIYENNGQYYYVAVFARNS